MGRGTDRDPSLNLVPAHQPSSGSPNAQVPTSQLLRELVDLGGRPAAELRLERDPGLAEHMLRSLSVAGRLAINVEAGGRDDHHVAEAAFKAVGRSLRAAVRVESSGLPSTKGVV